MQLTKFFNCWVTRDGKHFAIHNAALNYVDSGYKLGEIAYFVDSGIKYAVTMLKSGGLNSYKVNLQRV
jgi:hypothetical protein